MGNREPFLLYGNDRGGNHTDFQRPSSQNVSGERKSPDLLRCCLALAPAGCPVVQGDIVDAAFSLEINHFRNQQTIQLMLKDIRLSDCELERDHYFLSVYSHFINGESLTDSQVNQLYPNRPDLVAVWRHIISQAEDKKLTAPYNTLSRRISYESRQLINIGKLFVCLDVFFRKSVVKLSFQKQPVIHQNFTVSGQGGYHEICGIATLRHRKRQSTAEQQSG